MKSMLTQPRATDQLQQMIRMSAQKARAEDEIFAQTGVEEAQLNKSIKELKMM